MFAHDILFRKEELIRSKDILVKALADKKFYRKVKFCLIRQQYLNKYENSILNDDKNSDNKDTKFGSDIKDSVDFEYKDLLNKLNDPNLKLKELSRIFPLDQCIYENFKKSTGPKEKINTQEIELISGIFAQGLLKFQINKSLYLFFFEDEGFLRQAFLQIKDLDISEYIIFELETNVPKYLKNNSTGNNINDKESYVETESYNLYILSNFDINIEKIRNEFDKIKEEKNLKSKKLADKNSNPSLNINDFVKNMKEKIDKNIPNINNLFKNQDIQKKEEIPEEKPPKLPTGLVGLINTGDNGFSCAMNATLQSLSSVGLLVSELLKPELYEKLEKNKESKMRLTFALAEVFKNLWDNLDDKVANAPYYFKNVINDMNHLIKKVEDYAPEDLVSFILETVHNELRTKDPNVIVDYDIIPNNRIFEEVYKDLSNIFLSQNKSIISDIFWGCKAIVICCTDMKCQSQTYEAQVSMIENFPLEEVRKFKNKNYETPVTIYDCFDYFLRPREYLSYYCESCHYDRTVISFWKFLYAPKVLIINLNREKDNKSYVNLNFDEFIELQNYVTSKDSPHTYELIAVISKFGVSSMGSHFIAYCKRLVNYELKWFKFDDMAIYESNFNEVKTSGIPYVLFYSYMKN